VRRLEPAARAAGRARRAFYEFEPKARAGGRAFGSVASAAVLAYGLAEAAPRGSGPSRAT